MTKWTLSPPEVKADVQVKPLVWQNNGSHHAGGHGYVVRKMGAVFVLTKRNQERRDFEALGLAKAAADAHHTGHVLSMLSTPPTIGEKP